MMSVLSWIGVLVWAGLGGALLYSWRTADVPPDADVWYQLVVTACYLVGFLVCLSGVVGGLMSAG